MESEWDLNGILMGYDISPQKMIINISFLDTKKHPKMSIFKVLGTTSMDSHSMP